MTTEPAVQAVLDLADKHKFTGLEGVWNQALCDHCGQNWSYKVPDHHPDACCQARYDLLALLAALGVPVVSEPDQDRQQMSATVNYLNPRTGIIHRDDASRLVTHCYAAVADIFATPEAGEMTMVRTGQPVTCKNCLRLTDQLKGTTP